MDHSDEQNARRNRAKHVANQNKTSVRHPYPLMLHVTANRMTQFENIGSEAESGKHKKR